MFKAFFADKRWAAWAYGGASILFFSTVAQVTIAYMLNGVFGDTVDILSNVKEHTKEEFYSQMTLWIGYSVVNDFIIVRPSVWFAAVYALKWRTAVHYYYEPAWHAKLQKMDGAAQRVEEDIHSFTNTLLSLALGFVSAVCTLVMFGGLLWRLGENLDAPFLPQVPGILIWVALTICIVSTVISRFVGRKLSEIEDQKRTANAALRYELDLTEKQPVYPGRARYSPFDHIIDVIATQRRFYFHTTMFDTWITAYALILEVLPNFVGVNALFAGLITYGVITKMIDAFGNVKSSFSFFIDNWQTYTVFKAVFKRLKELEVDLGFRKPKLIAPQQ